jgi:hypothetical protein
MPLEWKPADMGGGGMWISINGGSRVGKTVTALRLGTGIAGPKPLYAVDTEGRRMSHHAKKFKFTVLDMFSPYNPTRFAEIAEDAQDRGAGALITDSFSLEWNGEGGVHSIQQQYLAARNFDDKYKDASWAHAKGPGSEHFKMRNRLMQLTMPIIFCNRVKVVPKHLTKDRKEAAWRVQQDQEMLFEWTVAITMRLPLVGRPAYDMFDKDGQPLWKVPDDLAPLFPPDRWIGEAAGEGLRTWRDGGKVVLRDEAPIGEDKAAIYVAKLIARVKATASMSDMNAITMHGSVMQTRAQLAEERPELDADIAAAIRDAAERFRPRDDGSGGEPPQGDPDDDFPGVVTP